MSYRRLVSRSSSEESIEPVYATEKSAVQLEIPLEWNLWRIYQVKDEFDRWEAADLDVYPEDVRLVSGYKDWFISCRDPMDEDGFDDAAAFPALKPHRDIFGPPGCCRKQRGWYYVRRWPPVAHMAEKYATGADIPPELIDMIIKYCDTYGLDAKYLGMLRLVCRRWQHHFVEPHLYAIYAASSQRIKELSALQTKRLALGWKAYPINGGSFELKLDQPSKMQSWVEAVMRLGLNEDAGHVLTITGPVAPGRRLTSIYLSSPSRALWNPIPIHTVELTNIHFRKASDLVRLLRELPFLVEVLGKKVTWDASSEEGPRVTSFIPATLPRDRFMYYRFFDSQRGIACMLNCVLTHAGQDPMLQSDAETLSRLSADLDVSESMLGQSQDPMCMQWGCGCDPVSAYVDIWLERMHIGPQVRVVKCLIFSTVRDDHIQRILPMPWKVLADHIENLSMQPIALFLFNSTTRATLFSKRFATVPKMASLRASNRLIYALKDKGKQLVSVVKEGEDGEWITLAQAKYEPRARANTSESYCAVLYELVMRTLSS